MMYASKTTDDAMIDLSMKRYETMGIVPLDGSWEFYPQMLLKPGEFTESEPPSSLMLPQELIGYRGTATLRLRLKLPMNDGNRMHNFALKMPYFGAASKVWIDGSLRMVTGSINPFIPRYIPRVIQFSTRRKKADIVIQVANYHHRRMSLNRILFGTETAIREMTHRYIIRDSILFGSLLMLSLYHMLLFLTYRRDRTLLYFAIIAFITALREGIVDERILVRLWPGMPGEVMMKLGYMPVFLLLPLIILYIWGIAGSKASLLPLMLARGLLIASGVLLLFFPVSIYDWFFQYALFIFIALGCYVIVVIFSGKILTSKTGTILLAVGGAIVLTAALSDYFREINNINMPELLSFGILFFLLLQAYFLSWKLDRSYKKAEHLAEEVKLLNDQLEQKIEERTWELGQVNQRLERLSRIDPLTEIPNRRYFEEVYTGEWRRSERENLPLSLIMMDVDFFKAYNDNYGHPTGDVCLKKIATLVQESLKRGEDFVARYGGEEFIILLPGHPLESAAKVAERLRQGIQDLNIVHAYSEVASVVTVSLGIAEKHIRPGIDRGILVKLADQALYSAKRSGRNRVSISPEDASPLSPEGN